MSREARAAARAAAANRASSTDEFVHVSSVDDDGDAADADVAAGAGAGAPAPSSNSGTPNGIATSTTLVGAGLDSSAGAAVDAPSAAASAAPAPPAFTWNAAPGVNAINVPREAVNADKVAAVLPTIVAATEGMTLSDLTALLSGLRRVQYDHRDECDKTSVATALLECLQQHVQAARSF